MRYPRPLHTGDAIGVCAPSAGVTGATNLRRLDRAIENIRAMGYAAVESESVRQNRGLVSADAHTRAQEFMRLYEEPEIAAIIPPWGGEFLMDMLPHLDLPQMAQMQPKWVCGYSDITTLTFVLTLCCDMATVHGSNLMNMGYTRMHPSDRALWTALEAQDGVAQQSFGIVGSFENYDDMDAEPYAPTRPDRWKALWEDAPVTMTGRIIGGCLDVLCKLIGTRYAPVDRFQSQYGRQGLIWTLESCEMNPSDIYRTLWQMRNCGWLEACSGIVIGRADNCHAQHGYALVDALRQSFDGLRVPVLYDADIGHIPPQLQLINGAEATFTYRNGACTVQQRYVP